MSMTLSENKTDFKKATVCSEAATSLTTWSMTCVSDTTSWHKRPIGSSVNEKGRWLAQT